MIENDQKDNDKLKKKIMVNMITALRGIGGILLVPIFSIYGSIPAAVWFISFMATDWIDGYLARKYEVSSFFGALLDGMFDKLFGIISFLLLASISPSYMIPLLFEAESWDMVFIVLLRVIMLNQQLLEKLRCGF